LRPTAAPTDAAPEGAVTEHVTLLDAGVEDLIVDDFGHLCWRYGTDQVPASEELPLDAPKLLAPAADRGAALRMKTAPFCASSSRDASRTARPPLASGRGMSGSNSGRLASRFCNWAPYVHTES
jgi:hypothetical protein